MSLVAAGRFDDFAAAADFSRKLAASVLDNQLPPDTLLNVNVPGRPSDDIQGFEFTHQGKRRYGDAIVENVDPRGRKYYWIGGNDMGFVDAEGTDFSAIQRGKISITPLHLDLTNYATLPDLRSLRVEWP